MKTEVHKTVGQEYFCEHEQSDHTGLKKTNKQTLFFTKVPSYELRM